MKLKIILLFLLVTISMVGYNQTQPLGINYQAIARDAQGLGLVSTSITIRFSILQNGINGTLEWQESQTARTNEFGLFTLIIGQGDRLGGSATSFDSIMWGSGIHFLKVEADFGNGFATIGTTQMTAVPYALYAGKTGNASSGGISTITYDPNLYTISANGNVVANLSNIKTDALQNLTLNGNVLSLSQSDNNIDLSKYIDKPTLSLSGNSLSILNGNTVPLPHSYLLLEGNKLSLRQDTATYGSYTIGTNDTSQIQHLSYNGIGSIVCAFACNPGFGGSVVCGCRSRCASKSSAD